ERDRGIAHAVVLAVGERQRRRDGDRVARVDAHGVEVLDRADDDDVVLLVADDLELELLPADDRLLDEDLVDRRGAQALVADLVELLDVVRDAAARAAERERRADDRGEPELLAGGARFLERLDDARARALEADRLGDVLELLAILGALDDVEVGADEPRAVLLQDAA